MFTVHKFTLGTGKSDVPLPRGAVPLHVASQDGRHTLWALVDTDADTEARSFYVVGTGQEIISGATYLGTFHSGPIVWHAFEIAERPWTQWAGGECPVPAGVVIEYEPRQGGVCEAPGDALVWEHDGGPSDIVRFRNAAEQPTG